MSAFGPLETDCRTSEFVEAPSERREDPKRTRPDRSLAAAVVELEKRCPIPSNAASSYMSCSLRIVPMPRRVQFWSRLSLAFPMRIVLREHVFEVIPAFPFRCWGLVSRPRNERIRRYRSGSADQVGNVARAVREDLAFDAHNDFRAMMIGKRFRGRRGSLLCPGCARETSCRRSARTAARRSGSGEYCRVCGTCYFRRTRGTRACRAR